MALFKALTLICTAAFPNVFASSHQFQKPIAALDYHWNKVCTDCADPAISLNPRISPTTTHYMILETAAAAQYPKREAGGQNPEDQPPYFCDQFGTAGPTALVCQKGAELQISDTLLCRLSESKPCQFKAERSITVNWTLTTAHPVLNAYEMITHCLEPIGGFFDGFTIDWVASASRRFNESFELAPGHSGYLAFAPCLTCITGAWIGHEASCPLVGKNSKEDTACGPSAGLELGKFRLVQFPD